MSRKRNISTEVSLDKALNRLATVVGDFAALLYTWMIPHAEDDARLPGDPEEVMAMVVPMRRDKSAEDVSKALAGMVEMELIAWGWDEEGKLVIELPPDAFYKRQTYVPADKRRTSTSIQQMFSLKNNETSNSISEIAASPSPSPSLTPTLSVSLSSPAPRARVSKTKHDYSDDFEEFWSLYPRKIEKPRTFTNWKTRIKDGHLPRDMITAARHYAQVCAAKRTEDKYIKHPSTFLGPETPFIDYINLPEITGPAPNEPAGMKAVRAFMEGMADD